MFTKQVFIKLDEKRGFAVGNGWSTGPAGFILDSIF